MDSSYQLRSSTVISMIGGYANFVCLNLKAVHSNSYSMSFF